MHCTRCGVCCTKTQMLLSNEDISRLESLGYPKSSFVRFDKDSYAILKNRKGYCVFYDPQKMQCNIYPNRPAGCRVYPVICDEDNSIIVDHICHARQTVTPQEKSVKGNRVIKLLAQIDKEAQQRRSPQRQG
ncbi:MAG: YkgJ family cysteine cluster protein [Candidatus Bathyarchaeota archaeon]|nr:YkgJ family cysteine cluster protein [Candidatus Bathyarchaeota archaeon]